MAHTPMAQAPVNSEGALLTDIYGRLVRWH